MASLLMTGSGMVVAMERGEGRGTECYYKRGTTQESFVVMVQLTFLAVEVVSDTNIHMWEDCMELTIDISSAWHIQYWQI